jgi:hypothetical protein
MTTETKRRDKFLLLSTRRVEQAQHTLRLLGNLSAPNYDWDPKEVRAIFGSLRRSIDEAETKFRRSRRWN